MTGEPRELPCNAAHCLPSSFEGCTHLNCCLTVSYEIHCAPRMGLMSINPDTWLMTDIEGTLSTEHIPFYALGCVQGSA